MVAIYKSPLTADEVKAKARAQGADLVGIADGRVMNENPPDPNDPRRPSDVTEHDSARVIVLAKRYTAGTTRMVRWDDRHKYYNDELTLTMMEETALELVFWLEDQGYPAVIIPPTHVDPWRYAGDPEAHQSTLISLPHAAVEAGLGTLGLNLQLLTPEFGPRVMLTAVLASLDVDCDARLERGLCHGPACGRCLSTCPGDVVGHWDRDWPACDRYRSPHGFAQLADHVGNIIEERDVERQREMLRSEESFNLWQSILRGSGVVTGCRRCQDVCPVGADYEQALQDALEAIPEDTPEKQARLAAMARAEEAGEMPESYEAQRRWIGDVSEKKE
jgi:epoxyqueuosine reductase QueG